MQFVILVHFNCQEYGMQNLSFLCVLLFITMICIFFWSYLHVLPTITVMCRFHLFYLFYLSFGGGGGGGGRGAHPLIIQIVFVFYWYLMFSGKQAW